jgi:hypothetical protein
MQGMEKFIRTLLRFLNNFIIVFNKVFKTKLKKFLNFQKSKNLKILIKFKKLNIYHPFSRIQKYPKPHKKQTFSILSSNKNKIKHCVLSDSSSSVCQSFARLLPHFVCETNQYCPFLAPISYIRLEY